MHRKHTPEEVANFIKEIIRHNYGSLSEYAVEKNITPTQLYSLLNGKEYISLFSAVRFSNDLDINIEYCTKGILPAFTPEHDYKKLKKIAEEFFYAVREEDDFRELYENQEKNLNAEEYSQLKRILHKLRINKAKAACTLVDLLNMDTLDAINEKKIQTPLIPQNNMTLHEAIENVLRHSEHALTYAEIASLINEQGLYTRKDRQLVPASQISARVRHYPKLFEIIRETNPQTIKLITH